MIKRFEQFLNESSNVEKDYFSKYIDLSGECMLANIEFVKDKDGHVDFKKPIKLRFIDGGSRDKYIKIRYEDIVSIYVDNKKRDEEKFGDLMDKNENGEYLVAVTENEDNIVLGRNLTMPWDGVFDINSALVDHMNGY